MRDGVTLRNNYACDLDKVVEGNRIGMMRGPDGTLHYYLNGIDQGPACSGVPPHVYPVIELYGQCVQVCYHFLLFADESITKRKLSYHVHVWIS